MKKILLLIILVLWTAAVFAQNVTVTGRLVDKDGKPIAGATIREKGVTNTTLTDIDGNFQIKTVASNRLVLSMKGYDSKEITLDNNNDLTEDIVMMPTKKRVDFGVIGGIDYARNSKSDVIVPQKNKILYPSGDGPLGVDFNRYTGFFGGFYMDIFTGKRKHFAFEIGANIAQKSFAFSLRNDQRIEFEQSITTLEFPFLLKWRIPIKQSAIHIFLGWHYDIGLNTTSSCNYKYEGDGADMLNKDFKYDRNGSGLVGLGYEHSSGLGIRAYASVYGAKSRKYDISAEFIPFQFSLTYKF